MRVIVAVARADGVASPGDRHPPLPGRALWLRATLDGLSVVPLSQLIEVEETRASLRHDVLGGLAVPHLLVRLGWQALSRSQLIRTGRRPVHDVLDQADAGRTKVTEAGDCGP